jgi:hypothetical protein
MRKKDTLTIRAEEAQIWELIERVVHDHRTSGIRVSVIPPVEPKEAVSGDSPVSPGAES